MRLVGSIVALLIALVLAAASAANYVAHNCTTLGGLEALGVKSERICEKDNRAGTIFAALAIVFLVFAVMAFRAHRKHRRMRRAHKNGQAAAS
jgi:predicted membrane protein